MKEEKTGQLSEIIFHNEENQYTIAAFETETDAFIAVGETLIQDGDRVVVFALPDSIKAVDKLFK